MLDGRSHDASACLMWASDAVDGLYYLQDIEDNLPTDALLDGDHKATTVHITHARWAAGTAMTALDLCAASIGFLHLPPLAGGRFYDLGRLVAERKKLTTLPDVLRWINGVTSDQDYTLVREVRALLTHRNAPRHFRIGVGGEPQTAESTGLTVPSSQNPVAARAIVRASRTLATKWVEEYVLQVSRGNI
jgi:hypothetical protein